MSKYGHTWSVYIYVTVFRKTNRSARKSIIAYARKYAFEQEDANVNKEKEARFTRRRNIHIYAINLFKKNLNSHLSQCVQVCCSYPLAQASRVM